MNLAYFRKSKFSFAETLKNAKDLIEKKGLKLLGEIELPNQKGKALIICNENWFGNLLAVDKNLFGLLPCQLVILKENSTATIGVADPAILGGVTHNPAVHEISHQAESILKELVDEISGAGPLKPVKIKLYSTTTCPYCKMEKAWLESHKIEHDLTYVDLNPQEAENLVAKTGQMGVPVTEIIYEDADPEFVIGFDKEKLSRLIGVKD